MEQNLPFSTLYRRLIRVFAPEPETVERQQAQILGRLEAPPRNAGMRLPCERSRRAGSCPAPKGGDEPAGRPQGRQEPTPTASEKERTHP